MANAPEEKSADTEGDSDDSDEETANPNHLSRGILQQPCEVRFNDSDFDEEDDNIPLSVIRNNLASTSKEYVLPMTPTVNTSNPKRRRQYNWSENIPLYNINQICTPRAPSEAASSAKTPLEFFNLFWSETIIEHIVTQSNKYAQQKNVPLNITREEFYVVLGAMLLSGYTKCPNKRMYWSSTEDVPKIIYNSIRLNRFEIIIQYLHFNDNFLNTHTDKLYKLRPIIIHLNENFRQHGGLEEHISIDESMIPYYGKHYAKQYIKGKPIRFGYKNWALCTRTGYCVTFDIYTGKSDARENKFGLGGDVVLTLLENAKICPNSGYKIYFDNYFTSIGLLDYLANRNICAMGTVRENRLERCPFPDKKEWNKKPRGAYKFMASESVLMVKWKDNKVVTAASNFSSNSIVKTSRWCRITKFKKQIDQPEIIANYNIGMGGVDKMDSLVAVYRTRIRQRKWYWPIFAYLVDVSVSNAWLLMKKHLPKDKNCSSLLVFRRYIANSLLQTYGTPSSRGRVSTTTNDVRFDNTNHIVVYSETHRWLIEEYSNEALGFVSIMSLRASENKDAAALTPSKGTEFKKLIAAHTRKGQAFGLGLEAGAFSSAIFLKTKT
ncbi:piggyBac transposable element-derived protein 2-like [Sitophilus oryzae]|uniref:PiggyBac transposable element-derived protein 2-like n=1 Tax=Sitophilus oryzae TaxID=7048 RepID=A0A6J2YGY8_SITOR|nr:piggyBac transposable element-derived protein 2-like [Sitophilus oryzae]